MSHRLDTAISRLATGMSNKEKPQSSDMPAPRPRLAATIILYKGSPDNPKILMGQRSKRHDFMPDLFVFPGGRVDRGDTYAPYTGQIDANGYRLLTSILPPTRARATILAAIRETFEETGLCLAKPAEGKIKNINNKGWDGLRSKGLIADVSGIEVIGRAVTPPSRPKRFDTWFLLKQVDDNLLGELGDSAELLNLGWYDFDQIQEFELPRITEVMLGVVKERFAGKISPKSYSYSRMTRSGFAFTHETA